MQEDGLGKKSEDYCIGAENFACIFRKAVDSISFLWASRHYSGVDYRLIPI
jgi:hypothetical protein